MTRYSQQGIGLIEVLVALLLLAVAMLGFSAMQINAVKATDESLMRTRAMSVMRGGADAIRAYAIPAEKNAFVAGVNQNNKTKVACKTTSSCTSEQMANNDGVNLREFARANEMQIRVMDCPGTTSTQTRQCMIASWGKTDPQMTDSNATKGRINCAKATGVYNAGATCFIMEAY